jgi:uncharacterized protein (DUF2249 family)
MSPDQEAARLSEPNEHTEGNMTQQDVTLDVRQVPPRDRHPMIFGAFDRLPAQATLRLINDHDPKPLYYQLQAERPGEANWEYLEEGPEQWVVNISRVAAPSA